MTARRRADLLPTVAAVAVLALVAGSSLWTALPLRAPMAREFGWHGTLQALAALLSLAATAALAPGAALAARRRGVRAVVTAGCLACGLVGLLVIPNLTHFWQLVLAGLVLGVARALVCAGCWVQIGRCAPGRAAAAVAGIGVLAGAALVTPWVSETVYRNSWREGAAAAAGLALVLATPLAYVLLPGSERSRADGCADGSAP